MDPDSRRDLQTTARRSLVVGSLSLLLVLLAHFTADLIRTRQHSTPLASGRAADLPPLKNPNPAPLFDPDTQGALLPRLWSVPARSAVTVVIFWVTCGRELPSPI